MSFTTDRLFRVYSDDHGDFIQISSDADGLDLVEIRSYDPDGKIESGGNARITMPKEQAKQVAEALEKYLNS